MTTRDKPASDSRIPLVSGAVIAVRSRPYLAYLLALAALGVGAWGTWTALDDSVIVHGDHDKLLRLESQVTDMRRQQQRLVDDLTLKGRRIDELTTRLGRIDDTLSVEQRRVWLLNESDHYLRLAQQHLLLTRDIVGARTLLDVADRLLAAHGDNRLLPLRQALARDRLALTAAQAVDVPGLYLRLGAFSERVASLQLPAEAGGRAAQRGAIVAPAPAAGGDVIDAGLSRLRSLVTIRRYDEPIRPLLGDADRALVRESLRLDLAQAQLALLRAEPDIFRVSLAAAKGRLARYYVMLPKAEYEGLMRELAVLAATDIRPALPDLAGSINALDALSAQTHRGPATLGTAP
jgi:uroporphyrin-3 C-methyltransferase